MLAVLFRDRAGILLAQTEPEWINRGVHAFKSWDCESNRATA